MTQHESIAEAAAIALTPRYRSGMHDYLSQLVERLRMQRDTAHRYLMIAHLFDDTMRMLDACEPATRWDAIIGVSYSSNRPGVAERWQARFGERVHLPADMLEMERVIVEQLARSLALCRKNGQRLIVQEVGGFVVPLLHTYFADQIHLVKGVVEITKQGVWRAETRDLAIPVLHCADSELKRLEAQRCGETIARCLDGIARDLGLSLAGRHACVLGAGWIGSGVGRALRRLDMIPTLVDQDTLKVVEARLDGFNAHTCVARAGQAQLIVGATGTCSITREVIDGLPDNTIIASGSSRQLEIDVSYLRQHPSEPLNDVVEVFHLDRNRRVLLVNDGYPVNFIPGSGSVADEIVETILAELIVLIDALARRDFAPGIHRITPAQEAVCADLWLELRDTPTTRPTAAEMPFTQASVPSRALERTVK